MNQSYKLQQVSNDDSLCADLSVIMPDEEEEIGEIKLDVSVVADNSNSNNNNNYNSLQDEEEEDEVPEDDPISELSQTFLIEQTKTHITERTHEYSTTSNW